MFGISRHFIYLCPRKRKSGQEESCLCNLLLFTHNIYLDCKYRQFFSSLQIFINKIMKMSEQKVTRDALREMEFGIPVLFTGVSPNEVESARAACSQMSRLLECRFTVSADYDARTVTITKTAV